MQERGVWKGKNPTHSVPEREEGEPAPKEPRTGSLQLRDEGASPEPSPSDPIAGVSSGEDSPPALESSPTTEGRMAHNGFTVLIWVKPEAVALWDHPAGDPDATENVIEEYLKDAACLLGIRWNMDIHLTTIEGNRYAFGINTRITVSEKTISNALGDLSHHVGFLRGTANNTAEDLARYKKCKEKWKVPEEVSTSSYGWEPAVHPETSKGPKQKRYF